MKTLFLFQRNFKKEAKKRAICIICFRKETRDEEITTGHSIYIGTVSSYPKDLYQVHIGNIEKWTPIERSLRSLLRSLIVKLLIDNIFVEGLGLRV